MPQPARFEPDVETTTTKEPGRDCPVVAHIYIRNLKFSITFRNLSLGYTSLQSVTYALTTHYLWLKFQNQRYT